MFVLFLPLSLCSNCYAFYLAHISWTSFLLCFQCTVFTAYKRINENTHICFLFQSICLPLSHVSVKYHSLWDFTFLFSISSPSKMILVNLLDLFTFSSLTIICEWFVRAQIQVSLLKSFLKVMKYQNTKSKIRNNMCPKYLNDDYVTVIWENKETWQRLQSDSHDKVFSLIL